MMREIFFNIKVEQAGDVLEVGCSVSIQELSYAEGSGFDFIELQTSSLFPEMDDFHFDLVLEKISKCSMPIKSFNAFIPTHIRITGSNADPAQYEAYVSTALRRMKALGGERVSFGSGHSRSCPADFSRETADRQIVRFLEYTADIADRHGIRVNVEALNRTECNMINSVLDAKRYVMEVNRPNVSLLADFYHMQMANEPLERLAEIIDHLDYVHVADTGRLYPGSGNYPFIKLIEMLREIGYRGPVSVECNWCHPEKEIPESAFFLKSIIRQG